MAGYGTNEAFAAWLAGQGLTLPVGAVPAVLRQIGSDYMDAAYEPRLACSRRTAGFAQERAFPRVGHVVGGETLPDDMIPQAWINGSYRAAYLHATEEGWALAGEDPNRIAKRERVEGAIDTEYFGPKDGQASGNAAPGFNVDPMIDGMVSLFLCPDQTGEWAGLWAIGS